PPAHRDLHSFPTRRSSDLSGIGGIDLGLERAGMRVLWQVECDPYARAVLARRFPDAVIHPDVRRVGAARVEPVDVIAGGFPCQEDRKSTRLNSSHRTISYA